MAHIPSLSLKPAVSAVKRWLINLELRNTEYHLAHIASVRRNDYLVEREIRKRQVHLQSELRRLEVK